jgi:hypothetical protein
MAVEAPKLHEVAEQLAQPEDVLVGVNSTGQANVTILSSSERVPHYPGDR